ncbi:hypothetical protein Tco_1079561 [Tanacetum coccineum]|uniref:Reverse transcriptase domain-containing protein n=1 Tax=Tanacetum coccineum TaxID=301880 RepID=A0ABQ5HTA6_9ASTR
MPVELGSFDVIIGMDWLVKYHAVIVCAEKIVRIPFGDEILIVHGVVVTDSSSKHGTDLTSFTKDNVIKEKRLERCASGLEFPKSVPEDLPGIPPTRQVEFRIDLVPGATPVARAPYRLAPSEMKELAEQLQELTDKGFIRDKFPHLGSSSSSPPPPPFVKKKDGFFRVPLSVHRLQGLISN